MTFPSARFDDLRLELATVPSFWTEIYDGRELVTDYLRGAVLPDRQIDQAADELSDSLSRQDCPIYHRWLWLPVLLAEADGRPANVLAYGSSADYGPSPPDGVTYAYGAALDSSWAFPLPAELTGAMLLADSIVATAAIFTSGTEFRVDKDENLLIFARNPFLDSRFHPYTEDDKRWLRVYLFAAEEDQRYLQTAWGAAARLSGASTPNFKQLLNAILDGVTSGCALGNVTDALSAIADIPLAIGAETVEAVTADADGKLVITDRAVYRFIAAATVLVAAGDELRSGQRLTDGLSVWPTNRGAIPSGLASLTITPGFLWSEIAGPLTFSDAELPLTVVGEVSGFTKVTFPITGDSADVAAFFTEMHSRGVAAGATLANHLDIRAEPIGQPGAGSLPTTVNPLGLLLGTSLRGNLLLVAWRPDQFGPNHLTVDAAALLRALLPPHTGLLLVEV